MKYVIAHIDRSEHETLVRISLKSDSGVVHVSMPNTAPILNDLKVGDECEIDLPENLVPRSRR